MGQLPPGFSSERPGFLAEASAFSGERLGSSSRHRPALLRPDGRKEDDEVRGFPGRHEGADGVGGDGDRGGERASGEEKEKEKEQEREEEGERRAGSKEEDVAETTAASAPVATAWGGRRREAGEQDFFRSETLVTS